MKTYLDCIPCFSRQALAAARVATADEGVHRRVLDAVSGIIPNLPSDVTPPEIARQVYRIVYDITNNDDPYQAVKQRSNQIALSLYPRLNEIVASSDDALLTACKLAIAGNSIDLGPQVDHDDLDSIIEAVLVSPLAIDHYQQLRSDIGNASQILYLGDNAGEIVFDRVLIEQLHQLGDFEITFVVRDKPIINDATMADALAVGLDRVARVISNGSDAPATILRQCSPQMLECYRSADVIISKGQGNYEALSGEQANIFFLLRVKCPVVAMPLKLCVGDAVLKGRLT